MMQISSHWSHVLKGKIEGITTLVEWSSLAEMKAPQGACMRTSTKARERQYEELSSDFDDQVWRDQSWQKYLSDKERSSAL